MKKIIIVSSLTSLMVGLAAQANTNSSSQKEAETAVCKFMGDVSIEGGCPAGLVLVGDEDGEITYRAKSKENLYILYFEKELKSVDYESCALNASGCD